LVAVSATDPTVLATELVTPATGVLAAELCVVPVVPVDPEPVSVEAADVTAESVPGFSSLVAACACLEQRSKRKRIPAAAIANCATRTVARYANSCDIDSSDPLGGTRPRKLGREVPRTSHARPIRTRRFCTVITVHHRRLPHKH
jgi:hypothetical protein